MDRFLRDRKAILLFVGPALLLYTVILLVPIVWSVGYTFYSGSPITGLKFSGWSNYLQLFHDRNFTESLVVSLKYAVIVTIGQIVFGLLLSMMYVFYIKRFSFLIRTLIFFPVVLPTVAVAQMFSKLFEIAPYPGLINGLFNVFHLHAWVQPWLGQENTAFWVLCIMDVWRAVGFYAVLIYAGLVDIPGDILEAAKLDGAAGWKLSRFVVLPLIRPILVSAIIFSLNGTLKVFDSPIALTGGGPGNATTTLSLYMYNAAFSYGEYGYGSTVAVFLLALSLFVTLLVYRSARKDVA